MNKTMIATALMICALANSPIVTAQNSKTTNLINSISQDKVAKGLKEALDKGITEQVNLLAKPDGFLKNELVKIVMPEEFQKVDKALRRLGMGSLADQGTVLINRAAENAVKEATPIFVDAIKNMTFSDAKDILIGGKSAATDYLKKSTTKSLYEKFSPVINTSLSNVGADVIWEKMSSTYNSLPLVSPVTTDLTDYITTQTMDGVFKAIAVEEKNIRENITGSRDTKLLKDVFAIQDNLTNSTKNNTSNNSKKKQIKNKQ
ncbi:DUF4197 domain-containing protein [Myroides marinus]|uniref:DUF4197 domain-containing protein n=2 Tax=Myroides marinus TaxID=703342 RepID=A0A161S785_9FLAO|nr:DUF4197 domain-containing protein [Myroides marinus]KZE80964.1 hypothetical protein AV926_09325 [Myroides marinus]MDM1346100.1 DUF4197 domain-containing protein [Myroides marinus]MDM1352155.1 DUF4197 domain-containing protein [Myroides marinus]MDM1353354.1 DUF4197 domain-containing protein [Myroides marinus]MDM1359361.1 DUF4197 domain-containing protein [Myroides marinus]